MSHLNRILVDKFKIEDSIDLETLEKNKELSEFLNKNIITIEEVFKELQKISLNARKEMLFLNGVRLSVEQEDGLYNIYSEKNKYIGLGIVKNKLLKRDIICN